jgi:hypothetical protein
VARSSWSGSVIRSTQTWARVCLVVEQIQRFRRVAAGVTQEQRRASAEAQANEPENARPPGRTLPGGRCPRTI